MPNRETWDWQNVEPDQTITMTLLFNRTPKDDGRKEGADYDWHRYPVSVGKTDWTMFTPSEFMHSALQALGVDKKGDVFRATKKIDGWNKETKKQYTYYELERDGTKLRTDRMDDLPQPNHPPTETPQQQVEKVVKETVTETNFREMHRPAFRAVLDNIMEYYEEWCPSLFKDRDTPKGQERIAKLITDIVSSPVMAHTSTLIITNGNKK